MRLATELKVVDKSLAKRAEWMIESGRVQKYLMPKVEWVDPQARHPSPKNRVDVLCVGSGKGHEAVEILMMVPGSEVTLVDPHDGHTETVKEMIETLSDESKELSEEIPGEDLKNIEDGSMDGVTMNFTLHNVNGESRRAAALAEARRVLKADGYLFVAEDVPETEQETKRAALADRTINLEPVKRGEKKFMNVAEWTEYFDEHGFEIVETNDKPTSEKEDLAKDTDHVFFVLRKKKEPVK